MLHLLLEFTNKIKTRKFRGIEYPSNYVATKMRENEISALFCGHDHEKPKKVLSNTSEMDFWDLFEETDGFCEIKFDYGYKSPPIYTTISGTICYEEFNIAYKPSYARLLIEDNFWNVEGHSLDG